MSAIGQASCFARHVATPGPACSHTLGHTGPHSWEPAPSRDHRALEDSFDEARAQASQAPGLAFEVAELRATLATMRADLEAAAGPLLIPMPPAGSDLARLLSANAILRRQSARGNALANAARAWSAMVRKTLADFPLMQLLLLPEASALVQASAELDAGLGPLPPRHELAPPERAPGFATPCGTWRPTE